MDTATLREIIKQVINRYAAFKPSHGDIRLDVVFDEARDRYALMQVGWSRGQRVRGNLIYITLHDGKVYLEYDGMEQGITQSLLEQGIPAEAIVDAYLIEAPVAIAQ
jgi:XisI protein